MKRLRTYVLEDDPAMQKLLCAAVERSPGLELVGTSVCPMEAGGHLSTAPVDLLFLDIGLPQLDGYRFLGTLPRVPQVIVVSADADHAAKAFDHAAVDFLYKPFTQERFMKAVQRAIVQHRHLEAPAAPARPKESGDTLLLKTGKSNVAIPMNDIDAVQSVGNYVRVYSGSSHIVATSTMQAMDEKLPSDRFVRIHRGWIVAFKAIRSLDAHGVRLQELELDFGGLYKRQAYKAIKEYFKTLSQGQ